MDKWLDLRTVRAGEACPECGGTLEVYPAIEVGHIFKLGTFYADKLGLSVLYENGKTIPIVMGSYGIGIERNMAASVEANHDENGIIWPGPLARSMSSSCQSTCIARTMSAKLRNPSTPN